MHVKIFTLSIIILSLSYSSYSQNNNENKIQLFVDCSNAFCDMNFIKTQIKFIDYTLDNTEADIHLLITQQSNGGGGSQYQLIFYGQKRFHRSDTLRFDVKPSSTNFEIRERMIKYIQLGLLPFLSRTKAIDNITLELKDENKSDSIGKPAEAKDKWDYWVYRVGVNGNINTDANYTSLNYNGNLSASRITNKKKLTFNLSVGKNKNSYQYNDGTTTSTITVRNENYDFTYQLAASVTQHFSIGYDIGISRSTFNNYSLHGFFRPAIEYNLYRYKDVNNKFFTIRYGIDVTKNQYFDTTIYFKKHETLAGQELDLLLTYNQKWGTVNLFSSYHAFLSNLKRFDLSLGGGVNVRISGGLSFNVFMFGNYLRDQIYLPKGQASFQDILTRQRQLATNFTLFSFFGISYRFGSSVNNFVNPRFNSGGGSFSF